jgi:starch synthase
MNVVVIASEAVPFAKTGGLADVMGALPRALGRLGHDVTLILPCYRDCWQAGPPLRATGWTLRIPVGAKTIEGVVHVSRLPDSEVTVYLVDQPSYFDREGLYQQPDGADWPDNAERFAFFARGAVEVIRRLGARPDVVHANDWQTGLVPVYLREHGRGELESVGTLLTVHNLAYQGLFPASDLAVTGLDPRLFNWRQLEFHGRLGYLKAGLVYADMINTVSPGYAREIQTPAYGCGLDGLLRARRDDLRGIINGMDHHEWGPRAEPMIARPYDLATVRAGKAACKAALQRLAGLPERQDVPLLAQIGRLDPQKGWDLLAAVADDLLRGDVQMVVLGEGQPRYHELLERLAREHPRKLRAFLEFDGPLAHQIEAGADLCLMPSLYEPCGLNQLYSMAHGTVPLVRATGGLADTVVDATPETLADGTATGFVFHDPTPEALRAALDRALAVWKDRPAWDNLIGAGMRADWSWGRSARQYVRLYEEVSRRGLARVTGGARSYLARAV